MNDNSEIIHNGIIVVSNGTIICLSSSCSIPNNALVLNFTDGIVIPG